MRARALAAGRTMRRPKLRAECAETRLTAAPLAVHPPLPLCVVPFPFFAAPIASLAPIVTTGGGRPSRMKLRQAVAPSSAARSSCRRTSFLPGFDKSCSKSINSSDRSGCRRMSFFPAPAAVIPARATDTFGRTNPSGEMPATSTLCRPESPASAPRPARHPRPRCRRGRGRRPGCPAVAHVARQRRAERGADPGRGPDDAEREVEASGAARDVGDDERRHDREDRRGDAVKKLHRHEQIRVVSRSQTARRGSAPRRNRAAAAGGGRKAARCVRPRARPRATTICGTTMQAAISTVAHWLERIVTTPPSSGSIAAFAS